MLGSGVNWGQVNMCSTERASSLLHEGPKKGKRWSDARVTDAETG